MSRLELPTKRQCLLTENDPLIQSAHTTFGPKISTKNRNIPK